MNAQHLSCVLSDSECGQEPFKGPAGLHRGPAASTDTQSEGYDANHLFSWVRGHMLVRYHSVSVQVTLSVSYHPQSVL